MQKTTETMFRPDGPDTALITFVTWSHRTYTVLCIAKAHTITDLYWTHASASNGLRGILGCGEKTLAEINAVLMQAGFLDLDAFREQYMDAFSDTEGGANRTQISLMLSVSRNKKRINRKWFSAIIRCQNLLKEEPRLPRGMLIACMRAM